MKLLILLPLGLLLAIAILGCRTRSMSGSYRVRAVEMWHLGEADLTDGELRLAVSMKGHPDLVKMVCAHELGHVIGLEHQARGTIMAPTHSPREKLISRLSDKEKEIAGALLVHRALPIQIDLGGLPDYMVDGMRWGMELWNRALVDPSNRERGYVRVFVEK